MIKILLIEDELLVLENISELLILEGFEVIKAENGRIGVELAKSSLPDLIISDVLMPELDGFGVLEELSKDSMTNTIPFIFLTAKADRPNQRFGMDLGADDYLIKPFTPDEIYKAIYARLKKKHTAKAITDQKINQFSLNIASTIPHELRTPLNGILTTIQMLKSYSTSLDKDEIEELHDTIYESAKRLESIIYKYLTYVEAELILFSPDKLDSVSKSITENPNSIINDIIISLSNKYNRTEDTNVCASDAVVLINPMHLQVIITELYENAVKFSTRGTQISIYTSIVQGKFVIEVSDNGIGLTKDEINNINTLTQFGRDILEQQGLGLGLAIVQRIAQIYNGKFLIDSIKNNYTKAIVYLQITNE